MSQLPEESPDTGNRQQPGATAFAAPAATRNETRAKSDPQAIQWTVLVVDDDVPLLTVMKRALETRFRVFGATNTAEAEAVLSQHPIQVVVCDLHLREENGLDFLFHLRQTQPLISRLLLTGSGDAASILDAINRCGVQCYLVKPISMADLLRAVGDAALAYDAAEKHAVLGKENADLRHSLNKVLSRSAALRESPAKLLLFTALGLFALLVGALLLGLLVFIILYALKSALGLDLFPNQHLADFL